MGIHSGRPSRTKRAFEDLDRVDGLNECLQTTDMAPPGHEASPQPTPFGSLHPLPP